jgi:hypothetical protein
VTVRRITVLVITPNSEDLFITIDTAIVPVLIEGDGSNIELTSLGELAVRSPLAGRLIAERVVEELALLEAAGGIRPAPAAAAPASCSCP